MTWIVIAIIAVFVVALVYGSLDRSSATVLAQPPAIEKPEPISRTPAPRLSAADLLLIVERLRREGTVWDWEMILPQLNPNSNSEIQSRILVIKGPHDFNANAALGTIALGCKKVISKSANATAIDALNQAIIDLGIIIDT